jgi:hypothetical protein
MRNPAIISTVDIFFLGSGLPNNLKRAINKLINRPGVPAPSVPALMDLLLFEYPMAHDWQSEIYSLEESELAALRLASWWRGLFKIPFSFPTNYVVHQDDDFIMIQLDSIHKLLLDEVRPMVALREFYLFLLENQNLPGFMLISKALYKSEAGVLNI